MSTIVKNADRLEWDRCVPYAVMYALCLGVFWVGWSWTALAVAGFLYALRVFVLTGFYHRYFSHRAFKTSRAVQFSAAAIGCTAFQCGPIWWASHHRHHHIYSDQDPDLHSPRRQGFWWSHMGWFLGWRARNANSRLVPDLERFPELQFLERFHVIPGLLLGVALYALGHLLSIHWPELDTSGAQLLIWGLFVSTVCVYHVTYLVNSATHLIGHRRYITKDDSRNNFVIAMLTFGEGWHNNHHHYQNSARQGFFWWEIDLTYYILVAMSRLRLVWDIRPVPSHVLHKNLHPQRVTERSANTLAAARTIERTPADPLVEVTQHEVATEQVQPCRTRLLGESSGAAHTGSNGVPSRAAEGTPEALHSKKNRGVLAIHRWLCRAVLRNLGNPPIEVQLWNGEVISTAPTAPVARVEFLDRGAFHTFLLNRDPGFGDLYSEGRIEVHGDIVSFLESVFRMYKPDHGGGWLGRWLRWIPSPSFNSLRGSQKNIHHHYDIGNDFYRWWLDEQLVYTCAYFPTSQSSLDEAQIAKMDHVCRKLRLRPGQTVIEAGCGWGALSLHMARNYGVSVRAFNISREQIALARQRTKEQGLTDQVEFIDDDYRNIASKCDAFVSVGMLEHVGMEHYGELGAVVNRCLKPEGLALIHSVGRNFPSPLSPWIERRIFPGAYVPALSEIARIFEPWSFSVLDVENLRLHYARTLQHWLERFDAKADLVRSRFGEKFIRMWRFYLISSIAGFNCGLMQLFQIVFAKSTNNSIPMTRNDLYAAGWCR